jgi:hypothetical protein
VSDEFCGNKSTSENFQIPLGCSLLTCILYLNDGAACVVIDEGNISAIYEPLRRCCVTKVTSTTSAPKLSQSSPTYAPSQNIDVITPEMVL